MSTADNTPVTSLHSAVLNNDFERVQQFIKEGANLNEPNDEGLRPVHIALRSNNKKIVELLRNHGVDIDMTAWIYAIMLDDKDLHKIMRYLGLGQKVLKAVNSQGETLVHYCVKYRSSEILRIICTRIKDIVNEVDNNGYSPLHLAVMNNDEKMIKILLQLGANVYAKTSDGRSPVHFAVQHQCFDTLTMLIEANIDVNDPVTSTGKRPLHFAVENNDISTVNLLIRSGANLQCADNEGKTLLHVAVQYEHEEMLKLLLKKNLNVNARFGDKQESVLDFALFMKNSKIIEMVLNYNPDLNSKNKDGLSAIFIAMQRKLFVDKIFALKPDLNIETSSGDSLLLRALKSRNSDIVNYLIENKIGIEKVNNKRKTALHFAAKFGNAQHVSQLLQLAKLDVNAKTAVGNTPLHSAMSNTVEVVNIVKILLDSGADVNAENKDKQTPLFLINVSLSTPIKKELFKLLLDKGADVHHFDVKGNGFLYDLAGDDLIYEEDVFDSLLERNIDFNKISKSNDNIFHALAKKGFIGNVLMHFEMFEKIGVSINGVNNNNETALNLLLELEGVNSEFVVRLIKDKGAIANKNKKGESPLHVAIKTNKYETVQYFLKNNAELNNITDNGSSILHYAVAYQYGSIWTGNNHILKFLLKYNLENIINLKNNDGRTALHLAALADSLEMVEMLCNGNIDINVKDLQDNSALCYAIANKNLPMVKFLLKKGASTDDCHRGRTIYDLAKESGDKHIYQVILLF